MRKREISEEREIKKRGKGEKREDKRALEIKAKCNEQKRK